MPKFTVSPGNHTWSAGILEARAFFHAREGRMPLLLAADVDAGGLPKPKGAEQRRDACRRPARGEP